MPIKTDAILFRADGTHEVIRDFQVDHRDLCTKIGARGFDLVRLTPRDVANLEREFGVRWRHKGRHYKDTVVEVCMVADDEGLLDRKPYNRRATILYTSRCGGMNTTPIVGDVLVCEVD